MEWELAARGGLGDKQHSSDETQHNLWQGEFPKENLKTDGFAGTAPVDQFNPNALGFYNLVGNVWEWTKDDFKGKKDHKVLRGGSFLDTATGKFNHRARDTTRMGNTPDSSGQNTGFRCASGAVKQEL